MSTPKEVWIINSFDEVEGPYLLKERCLREWGGWAKFHDRKECARPDDVFDTKIEALWKIHGKKTREMNYAIERLNYIRDQIDTEFRKNLEQLKNEQNTA